jgi:hypothetical protein
MTPFSDRYHVDLLMHSSDIALVSLYSDVASTIRFFTSLVSLLQMLCFYSGTSTSSASVVQISRAKYKYPHQSEWTYLKGNVSNCPSFIRIVHLNKVLEQEDCTLSQQCQMHAYTVEKCI